MRNLRKTKNQGFVPYPQSIASASSLLLLVPAIAFGQDLVWQGAVSEDFNEQTAWNPQQAPTSSDFLEFDQTGTSTVTFSSDGNSDLTEFREGTFVFQTGSNEWTNVDAFRVGSKSGQVVDVTFDGGTLTQSGGNQIQVGENAGDDNNTLTLVNGATATGSSTAVDVVGREGAGNTFDVLSGSTFTTNRFTIGQRSGGNDNTLNVSGSGSSIDVAGLATVSSGNTGNSFVIQNGASGTISDLNIGVGGTSAQNNSVTFTGSGTTVDVTGSSEIRLLNGGTNGNELMFSDGVSVNAASTVIENTNGDGENTFTMSGGTASVLDVQVDGNNNVVVSGGDLNIGGSFTAGSGGSNIDFSGGTITAAGSSLADGITVGDGNNATTATYVLDGGTHTADGPGITLNSDGVLKGTGTVLGGGVTTAANSVVAPGNSIGTLTIDGTLDTTAGAVFEIELDAGFNADSLDIDTWEASGAGTDSLVFDFIDLGGAEAGTYTIATFNNENGLTLDKLTEGNTPNGFSGDFVLNANSLEYDVNAIPEPLSAGFLGAVALSVAVIARRRRSASARV